jgi:hypothetical protein
VLLTAGALGFVVVQLPTLVAQQSGGPNPAGRQSQGVQNQTGPAAEQPSGVAMPGEPGKPPPPIKDVLIGGKVVKMEDVLKTPPPAKAGEQPTLAAAKDLKASGGGGQKEPKAVRAAEGKHLHVVLRVTESGTSEVVSALEVPGPAPLTEEPAGTFIYEVSEDSRTVVAQALPDPFEMRSFSTAGSPPGHHFSRAKDATIVVKVPKTTLDSPLEKLSVKLLRLKPGEPVERINAETLGKLKQANRLQTIVAVPATKLAPGIRQKALRVPVQ